MRAFLGARATLILCQPPASTPYPRFLPTSSRCSSSDMLLADVWLSGEVSGFTQASSGHCYFTLKDAGAILKSVIWRTQAKGMALPRNGDAVIVHGAISVYEQGGAYQLYVDHLEPAGVGQLWLEFERLKARLEAEGLFDAARKRPLPAFPARHRRRHLSRCRRLPGYPARLARSLAADARSVLAPTLVQGEEAPPQIVKAIAALNRLRAELELDVIIVARGGGSIEDLWAFNDEGLARLIARSPVPVVTGVGHETDFTIADFVADQRDLRPSAAAAAVTPDAGGLRQGLDAISQQLAALVLGDLESRRQEALLRCSPLLAARAPAPDGG